MCECRATATALIAAYTDALPYASASEHQQAIAVIHALRQVVGVRPANSELLACALPHEDVEVSACQR